MAGKPEAWGGGGQAVFVVQDMEVVITHTVDNATWAHGWSQVDQLVRRVLEAKVF